MSELIRHGLVVRFDFSMGFTAAAYIIIIVSGYLLGSLNTGIIISRLAYKEDIRNFGSGGTGMTNMLRTYGKPAAAATFLGDGLKAVIAAFIGMIFFGSSAIAVATYAGPYVGGLAAVLGHAYPIYYKFKGGRSVAATFFMVMCTEPIVGLICIAIFMIIAWWTKYISLGSIMSVVIYPLILNRLTGSGLHNVIAIVITLLIVYFHRENIKRLGAGTENKLNLRKTEKKKRENKE